MKMLYIFAAVALLAGANAQAAVVVDESPDAAGFTNEFNASNIITSQNFFTRFTLSGATTLTGMDIYSSYTSSGLVNVGDAVVVRFRADAGGAPGVANLASIATVLSAIDGIGSTSFASLSRLHADFSGVALAAGTYWASMAGVSEIGWSLDTSQADSTYQFQGENQQLFRNWYAPFRLFDDGAVVPEPATWAMMIAGFGLVGGAMRRTRVRPRIGAAAA